MKKSHSKVIVEQGTTTIMYVWIFSIIKCIFVGQFFKADVKGGSALSGLLVPLSWLWDKGFRGPALQFV